MLVWGLIIFKEYALLKVFAIVYFSLQIIPFIAFQVFNQNYVFNYISSLQQYATDSQAGITLFSWILFIVFFSIISMLFYVNYLQFKRKEIKL